MERSGTQGISLTQFPDSTSFHPGYFLRRLYIINPAYPACAISRWR
jgi:hypothetical protein